MHKVDELIEVGHTLKPHGLNGEIKVRIDEEYYDDFLSSTIVFIESSVSPLPYFMESCRGGETLIVKLEDLINKEMAGKVSGKIVYLRQEDVMPVEEIPKNELDWSDVQGYSLYDESAGITIGHIKEVQEWPNQWMAIVPYMGKEVLIPLHQSLMVVIDAEKKVVKMRLPDGLLEL